MAPDRECMIHDRSGGWADVAWYTEMTKFVMPLLPGVWATTITNFLTAV